VLIGKGFTKTPNVSWSQALEDFFLTNTHPHIPSDHLDADARAARRLRERASWQARIYARPTVHVLGRLVAVRGQRLAIGRTSGSEWCPTLTLLPVVPLQLAPLSSGYKARAISLAKAACSAAQRHCEAQALGRTAEGVARLVLIHTPLHPLRSR
jgi:hypothetical protein